MITEKKCKGQHKASGFEGCGLLIDVKIRKYGLCPKCRWLWMQETKEGREHYKDSFMLKTVAKKESIQKEKKKRQRIELLTPNQYRARYVQPIVNEIAREIDYAQTCIAGRSDTNYDAGHLYSVGSNLTLALNLHNIHKQSVESNQWKSGDQLAYPRESV